MAGKIEKDFYKDKRVLVTGHTGFKGSWLIAALSLLEAKCYGISRNLTKTSELSVASSFRDAVKQFTCDVNNYEKMRGIIDEVRPEIIFHLAAQPLVSVSYQNPRTTIIDNVIGTANICNIFNESVSAKKLVIITTDKVYRNQNTIWQYREHDSLGGHDPYSASKSAADIVAQSYYQSFLKFHSDKDIYVMRGGNVIGGGDMNTGRLIPDYLYALKNKSPLSLRNLSGTRPWQHVIDLIHSYLFIAQFKIAQDQICFNVGPDRSANLTVKKLIEKMNDIFGVQPLLELSSESYQEASLLSLDNTLIENVYGWKPLTSLTQGIELIKSWHFSENDDKFCLARDQLRNFMEI